MTSFLLLLLLSGFLLVTLLVVFLRGIPGRGVEDLYPRLDEMVPLPGLRFQLAARLFERQDYNYLRSRHAPAKLLAVMRSERKRLALMWLRLLRDDLRMVWQFRRVLAAHGVTGGVLQEIRLAIGGVAAIILVQALRLLVFTFGPFYLGAWFSLGRRQLGREWRMCVALFGRLPAHSVPAFESSWKRALATEFVLLN